MGTIAKIILTAGIVCFVSVGEVSAQEAAAKANCYKDQNCKTRIGAPEQFTKQQCKNGGGHGWGDPPTCEKID